MTTEPDNLHADQNPEPQDFRDHLIHDELRELLAGDGPSADLEQRILQAVELRQALIADSKRPIERRESAVETAQAQRPAPATSDPAPLVGPSRTPTAGVRTGSGPRAAIGATPPVNAGTNGARTRPSSDVRGNSGRKARSNGPGTRRSRNIAAARRDSLPMIIGLAAAAVVLVAVGVVLLQGDDNSPVNPGPDPIIVEVNNLNGRGGNRSTNTPSDPANDPDGNGAPETVEGPNNPDPDPQPDENTPSPTPDPRDPDGGMIDRPGPDPDSQPVPDPDQTPDPRDPPDRIERDPQPPTPDPRDPVTPDPDQTPDPRDPPDRIERDPQPDPVDPDPVDPDGGSEPALGPVLATINVPDRRDRLKIRRGEEAEWEDWQEPGAEVSAADRAEAMRVRAGMWLRTTGEVDLTLSTGALMRFNGQVQLTGDGTGDVHVVVEQDKEVYIDNLGGMGTVTLALDTHTARVGDGVAFLEGHRGWMEVTCLHGEVNAGGDRLPPGRVRALRERGNDDDDADVRRILRNRFFRGLPGRVMLRDDFDDDGEMAVEIEAGKIDEGVLHGVRNRETPANLAVAFHPYQLRGGEVLRIRVRVNRPVQLAIRACFQDKQLFIHHPDRLKPGEWHVLEVPLRGLDEHNEDGPRRRDNAPKDENEERKARERAANKLAPGVKINVIRIHALAEGREREALDGLDVELDWLEIARWPVAAR